MSLTLSRIAIPLFTRYLTNLSVLLDKAEAHAAAHKIPEGVLLSLRLYPDMHPLVKQVQLSCDFTKGAVSRLAGIPVPSFADDETSFKQLGERISRTLALVRDAETAAIDAADNRDISLSVLARPLNLKGQQYLLEFAIPNVLFHVTTAYAILRHNGLPIGKADFVGSIG